MGKVLTSAKLALVPKISVQILYNVLILKASSKPYV